MAIAGTILFAPTVWEIGTIVQTCTTGSLRSISFTIVAPQRVQVPQVEVRTTASTLALCSSWAISLPNLAAKAWVVPVPTVT